MSIRPPILGGLLFVLMALLGKWAVAQDHNAQAPEPPAQTAAEEIAYYRAAFSPPYNNWWLARQGLSPDTFCARFIADPDQRRAAFDKFLQDLVGDPVTKVTGLLEQTEWDDPAKQDEAIHTLALEMWNERDRLMKERNFTEPLSAAFELELARGEKEADPQLIALLHFELQTTIGIPPETASTWHPELFPPIDRYTLWSQLKSLHVRSRGRNAESDESYYIQMREQFIQRYGNPDESAPAAAPLVVNRFWYPKDVEATGLFQLDALTMTPVADGIWVTGDDGNRDPTKYSLYHVAIDPAQADAFTTGPTVKPPIVPAGLVATSDALFLLGEPNGQWNTSKVARYDLLSQNWDQHDAPTSSNIFLAAGHLYLSLRGEGISSMSGIALYDDQTGNSTILASSSRQPPQNQFDGRDGYSIQGIFTGPKNQPCMTEGFGESYIIQSTPGPWPALIPSGQLYLMQTDGIRTLIFGPRSVRSNSGDVVFMIDSAKSGPELWLGAPAPSSGAGMQGLRNLPPSWPRNPLWPMPPTGAISSTSYGFRGNDLFGLSLDQATAKNELVWYKRGQAAPFHILLDFKMSDQDASAIDAARTKLADTVPQAPVERGAVARMVMVPNGLCFAVREGFYFLPYAEIDAYIRAHPEIADIPASPPTPAVTPGGPSAPSAPVAPSPHFGPVGPAEDSTRK